MFTVFVIGTAGSGKTTFIQSFSDFLETNEIYSIKVNLDPAVDYLPYSPDIDIRDYITAWDIMKKYNLGPNGAIIAAVDMTIKYLHEIKEGIEELQPGYVLVDTPGQLELFAFRQSGEEIVQTLRRERAAIIFMIDVILALSTQSLISSILLAASVFYRFNLPMLILLNKIDLLNEKEIEEILDIINNPEKLVSGISGKKDITVFHESIVSAVENFIKVFGCYPISAVKNQGLDKVYISLQQIYTGGEDFIYFAP
ncbi:MAG: ATP/GTP-binding protein [Thermoproteales archaeon]|nr:ATP/GTP-binding protein [Thermoproteales archaeon]